MGFAIAKNFGSYRQRSAMSFSDIADLVSNKVILAGLSSEEKMIYRPDKSRRDDRM